MFDELWFERYQKALLFLLNNPIIGRVFRKMLKIDSKKNVRNISVNRVIFDEDDGTFTAEFYTDANFSVQIFYAFRWLWIAFHGWDMCLANKLIPQLNLGFDQTFMPSGASPPVGTCAGYVYRVGAGGGDTWANMMTGTAASAQPDISSMNIGWQCGSATDRFTGNFRGLMSFDTSSLGPDFLILRARISLCSSGFSTYGYNTPVDSVVSPLPALNIFGTSSTFTNNFTVSDYPTALSTPFSDDIRFDDFPLSGTYEDFYLNASGVANINKTGLTRICVRESVYDATNTKPGWQNSGMFLFGIYCCQSQPDSKKPKLVINFSAPVTIYAQTSNTLDNRDDLPTVVHKGGTIKTVSTNYYDTGVIEFDLSSLTGKTINRAKLYVYVPQTYSSVGNSGYQGLAIAEIVRDYNPDAACWNNYDTALPWTTAGCFGYGTDYIGGANSDSRWYANSGGAPTVNRYGYTEVGTLVTDMVANGYKGFRIQGADYGFGSGFWTLIDGYDQTYPPYLVVETTGPNPLPPVPTPPDPLPSTEMDWRIEFYDKAGVFLGLINDAYAVNFTWTKNMGCGTFNLTLAKRYDNNALVEFFNEVKIYINNILYYTGFITDYTPVFSVEERIEVKGCGYGELFNWYIVHDEHWTQIDPFEFAEYIYGTRIYDEYANYGGHTGYLNIGLPISPFPTFMCTMELLFNNMAVKDCFQQIQELTGATTYGMDENKEFYISKNFYQLGGVWGTAYWGIGCWGSEFNRYHNLIYNKHIESYQTINSITGLVNTTYGTGVDLQGNKITTTAKNQRSIDLYYKHDGSVSTSSAIDPNSVSQFTSCRLGVSGVPQKRTSIVLRNYLTDIIKDGDALVVSLPNGVTANHLCISASYTIDESGLQIAVEADNLTPSWVTNWKQIIRDTNVLQNNL